MRPKILNTREAGVGADGDLYGVTSIQGGRQDESAYRKRVCATCPWRLDAEMGRFPAQAFRESARTSYDGATSLFACHESGKEQPQTCAGFLQANGYHNFGVRIAIMRGRYDPRKQDESVPLYRGYREMAEANGVDAADPVLRNCRGNED